MPVVKDCQVLVVGGGPVGTTLAALLANQDVTCIVCEKSDEVYPLPRAAHIDHEGIRIFQSFGIGDQVIQHTRPGRGYEFVNADGVELFRLQPPPGPGPLGWPVANMIYQPPIEETIRGFLSDNPLGELRTRWEFKDIVIHPDHVEATFSTPQGEATLNADYIVACDGGASPTREALGIKLENLNFDEPWLVIDAVVPQPHSLPTDNYQYCDPKRPTTYVNLAGDRYRWEFMLLPGETREQALDDGFIEKLLQPYDLPPTALIERRAVYMFHALIADEWRRGRAFLAGDAAHQMPPFAGQGLCSGLRDVANLAWKLKAVIDSTASDGLLDTYQVERSPHVRAITEVALHMGRTVCAIDPEVAAARDKAMLERKQNGEAVLPDFDFPPLANGLLAEEGTAQGQLFPQPISTTDDGTVLRMDDTLGAGAWLISEDQIAHEDAYLNSFSLDDEALQPFAEEVKQWLSDLNVRAVLVRPDRYVFGAGDAAQLLSAYQGALSTGSTVPSTASAA